MQLGNNLWEHTNFNSRLQPTQIGLGTTTTGTSSTGTLGLDYTFGASASANNGSVQSQTITVGTTGTVLSQSYTYDQVNRLQTATESVSGTQQWSQSYGYDVFGNRWVTGYVPNTTLTPTLSSQISATNNRLQMGFSHYDGSGNLDTDPAGSGFTYDGENRQVTANVNGQPATYSYDGDGHRVMKTVGPTGSAVTTVFVYDAMGKLIAEYASDPVPPAPNGGGTSYLTTDHLGSTRVVTKQNQTVQARYDYLPFGEELGAGVGQRTSAMGYSAADSTKQKFTTKERDAESGLDYFLARYYSSAQGRFTSPDEFRGGPHEFGMLGSGDNEKQALPYADILNPQSLAKYQYAFNNPLRFVDPDGHQSQEKSEGVLTTLFRLLGLMQPSPTPDPGKQAVLNQRIPGQDGMTVGDSLNAQVEATKEAAESLQKINELIDPTGGVLGTYVGKQAGLRSNSDVVVAAAASALNFASPGKALGHFTKHGGEFGGAFKNAVQYVLGARAHVGSASSDVVRYQNAAGKVLVYNAKSNEFATHTGKTIHTYFKPQQGLRYVEGVIKRDGYKRVP
jgi:RHS repeat-associated protein